MSDTTPTATDAGARRASSKLRPYISVTPIALSIEAFESAERRACSFCSIINCFFKLIIKLGISYLFSS